MDEAVEIGCAQTEITPEIGTPLSGFIFRENKPSEGIDTPIYVRVLVIRQGAQLSLLASLELLAVSRPLEQRILAALEVELGEAFASDRCVLLATHTHSAPPVSPLEGETDADPQYLQRVCEATVHAAREAVSRLVPATLHFATLRIPGLTYNRRAVLADGRVSMALHPEVAVLERGPVDDILSTMVWRDARGQNLAVLVHFACHGAAVCTQYIQGDIPGEIARQVGELFDAPCIYLQGATGDLNPLATSAGRPAMLDWVDAWMAYLEGLPTLLRPLNASPLRTFSCDLPLIYTPLPKRAVVEQNLRGLSQIAHGDVDSPQVQPTLVLLADLMNFKPGERPDPAKAAFAAQALANVEKRRLAAIDGGEALPPCPLRVAVWRLGQVGLAFVAAELFALTGFRIRAASREMALLPVTYAAPIVGYLPDRDSIQRGGYEVNDAWRFYRQPAPFMPNSEEELLRLIRAIVETL